VYPWVNESGGGMLSGWKSSGQPTVSTGGIVKLSEFDQKFGNTRLHNSLIIQDSGSWPEGENQPNST